MLDEFFNIVNYDDTLKEICEKFSNQTIGMFLECVFNEVRFNIVLLYSHINVMCILGY